MCRKIIITNTILSVGLNEETSVDMGYATRKRLGV